MTHNFLCGWIRIVLWSIYSMDTCIQICTRLKSRKVAKMCRAKLALLFAASCLVAFGNTIVVPNVNASVVGNDMDSSGGSGDFRSQELLGAGQFAAVSGPI